MWAQSLLPALSYSVSLWVGAPHLGAYTPVILLPILGGQMWEF